MKRSAAWSSSSVVTPGRTLRDSRSSTFVWMAPAAAMASISAGDFLMITTPQCRTDRLPVRRPARLQALFEAQRRQRLADVRVHVLGVARAVEAVQQPRIVVAVDQRLGLPVVDVEAVAGRLPPVVVSLDERRAVGVAHPPALRRGGGGVVDVPPLADAPAGPPLDAH